MSDNKFATVMWSFRISLLTKSSCACVWCILSQTIAIIRTSSVTFMFSSECSPEEHTVCPLLCPRLFSKQFMSLSVIDFHIPFFRHIIPFVCTNVVYSHMNPTLHPGTKACSPQEVYCLTSFDDAPGLSSVFPVLQLWPRHFSLSGDKITTKPIPKTDNPGTHEDLCK